VVGVLGVGRLGRALATRIRPRLPVVLSDVEPGAVGGLGLPVSDVEELGGRCDLMLVCLPPPVVADALAACAGGPLRRGLVVANLATSVPTGVLRADPRLAALTVAGLKPVCQYRAVAHAVPTTFVTASAAQLPLFRTVLRDVGTVLLGDEDMVGTINRAATLAALRACADLTDELAGLTDDERLISSAITNVFAGTAVDYPPDPANGYTAALLETLRAEGRHGRINTPGPGPASVDGRGKASAKS
jgi:hypothetical protein